MTRITTVSITPSVFRSRTSENPAALRNSGPVPVLGIGFLFLSFRSSLRSTIVGAGRPRYGVVARIQPGGRVASERTCRGTVYVGCGKVNLVESPRDGFRVACVPQQCESARAPNRSLPVTDCQRRKVWVFVSPNRSATVASQNQEIWQTKTPFLQHLAIKPQRFLSESSL